VLQGSWGIGYALSMLAYLLLFDSYGWRWLLWIGILPALAVVYIRYFVKEPECWVENKRKQTELKAEVKAPLLSIFKPGLLYNTLTGCLWMAAAFCAYYSIWGLFPTYLQDLKFTAVMISIPLITANIIVFAGNSLWGLLADYWGRRPAIMVPAAIGILVTPLYLWSQDPTFIMVGFILQGVAGGSIYGQNPSYLSERFPTEVRGTASGFVYHQGAIWGGLVAPVLTYLAVQMNLGFAIPMMISTMFFLVIVVISVLLGPETKGKKLTADLEVIEAAPQPI
jgi:MFS transporter, SHS family, lactate transporter